jgi:GNAT superfamily N-acetyltransferase
VRRPTPPCVGLQRSAFSIDMFSVSVATAEDAAALARLRCAAADHLTREHGYGHWSGMTTERGVLHGIASSRVLVARDANGIAGTLRLATKKPWAIDTRYFATVRRALYLLDMAVDPRVQRQGIGRCLLDHARATTRDWPADAIRLDAYDAIAGAGPFYAKCGFREVARVRFREVPLIYYELLL